MRARLAMMVYVPAAALRPTARPLSALSSGILGGRGGSSDSSSSRRRSGSFALGAATMATAAAVGGGEPASCGARVRVASYNVLSSSLCEPGYFVKCAREDLHPPTRLKRVQASLQKEIDAGAVICLQEVSQRWSGELHAFFAANGYQFSTGLYGNKFNGYMGVAVAWPSKTYDLVGVDTCRVADTIVEGPWERGPKPGRVRKFLDRLGKARRAITDPPGRPPFETWREASRKHNLLVTATLKPTDGSGQFCVASYHMPCLFGSVEKERVMVIHSTLAAKRVAAVAKGAPYVLAGDFNVKPYDASYALLTGGSLPAEFADWAPTPQPRPPADAARAFAPTLDAPLVSAYAAANGAEPDFTNFAYTRAMGDERDAFVECLDYVFCSPGQWAVRGVKPLPSKATMDITKPFPTKAEPSDHVLIAADLEIV